MAQDITIAFMGNPNCGKTTLFNAYTGANLKVANWPGVTVERVEGAIRDHDMNLRLVDLPGTYSLTSYTMEEQVSRQFVMGDEVDMIINVVDASSLERSLYLTLQLLEIGKPVVVALNMMDIVHKRGMEIDLHRLPEMLGVPAIPVSGRSRTGLQTLMHTAAHHAQSVKPDKLIHNHGDHGLEDKHDQYAMVYSEPLEHKIDLLSERLDKRYPDIQNTRWVAIKLLEQDTEVIKKYPLDCADILDRSYETEIINEKYAFIEEMIHEVLFRHEEKEPELYSTESPLIATTVAKLYNKQTTAAQISIPIHKTHHFLGSFIVLLTLINNGNNANKQYTAFCGIKNNITINNSIIFLLVNFLFSVYAYSNTIDKKSQDKPINTAS